MDIEGLIGGMIAVMIQEGFKGDPVARQRGEEEARVKSYTRQTGLKVPSFEEKTAWFDELTHDIENCADALKKLYDAIGYVPENDYKPGIEEVASNPKDGRLYRINFIVDQRYVELTWDENANFYYRPITKEARAVVDTLREPYVQKMDNEAVWWFNQVEKRIVTLTSEMVEAAQNWAYILKGGWPLPDYMKKRNYMSWDMFETLLRGR